MADTPIHPNLNTFQPNPFAYADDTKSNKSHILLVQPIDATGNIITGATFSGSVNIGTVNASGSRTNLTQVLLTQPIDQNGNVITGSGSGGTVNLNTTNASGSRFSGSQVLLVQPIDQSGNILNAAGFDPRANTGSNATIQTGSTALASNSNRTQWHIKNLAVNMLYYKMGSGCTTSSYDGALFGGTSVDDFYGGYFENNIYTGLVTVTGSNLRYIATERTSTNVYSGATNNISVTASVSNVTASINNVVTISGLTVLATGSFTRYTTTTAYVPGQVICNSTSSATAVTNTLSNVVRLPGYSGTILNANLIKSSNQPLEGNYEVYLFKSYRASEADSSSFSCSFNNATNIIGVLPFNTSSYYVTNSGSLGNVIFNYTSPQISFVCAPLTSSLYWNLVTRNPYIPVANEQYTLKCLILQD